MRSFDLSGRTALITGANGGIGLATARLFARAGARVFLTGRHKEQGASLAEEIGFGADYLPHDVTSEEDWARVIETVVARSGGLDILVNNAGRVGGAPIEQQSYDEYRSLLAVNLDSVFIGCTQAMRVMGERGGAIVNVGSAMGHRPRPDVGVYGVAKAAVHALTRAVALRCAELRNGVRCNTVIPGAIATDMTTEVLEQMVRAGAFPSAQAAREYVANFQPVGRLGEPEDVAHAILFLASPAAAYTTGESLAVDGGYLSA